MLEELSVTHPSIESAKQAFNIASLVKDQKAILDYLTSLHRKFDKVATPPPSIEIDTGDTLFRADDRSDIQRIKRKLGDLSADVTGIRNFLSFFGFKSSTTEGEKSSSQLNHPAAVSDPPPVVSDLPPVVSKPLVNQAVVPEPLIVDAVIEIQPQTNEPLVPVNTGTTRDEAIKETEALSQGEETSVRTLEETQGENSKLVLQQPMNHKLRVTPKQLLGRLLNSQAPILRGRSPVSDWMKMSISVLALRWGDKRTKARRSLYETTSWLEDPTHPDYVYRLDKAPDYVYRLDKALYGLKQAPSVWYDTLFNFLLDNEFV